MRGPKVSNSYFKVGWTGLVGQRRVCAGRAEALDFVKFSSSDLRRFVPRKGAADLVLAPQKEQLRLGPGMLGSVW